MIWVFVWHTCRFVCFSFAGFDGLILKFQSCADIGWAQLEVLNLRFCLALTICVS